MSTSLLFLRRHPDKQTSLSGDCGASPEIRLSCRAPSCRRRWGKAPRASGSPSSEETDLTSSFRSKTSFLMGRRHTTTRSPQVTIPLWHTVYKNSRVWNVLRLRWLCPHLILFCDLIPKKNNEERKRKDTQWMIFKCFSPLFVCLLITFTKHHNKLLNNNKLMFSPVSVCLLVCWFVTRIKQKLLKEYPQNLDGGWVST